MEELLYWYRPYIFFVLGFVSGGLDHPVKWVSVVLFSLVSLYISYARFSNSRVRYLSVIISGGVNGVPK